jgi:60S ribosomal subunit assembly/export protein LOC1
MEHAVGSRDSATLNPWRCSPPGARSPIPWQPFVLPKGWLEILDSQHAASAYSTHCTDTMAPTKSSKGAPAKGGASKSAKSASKSGDRPRPKKPTGPKPKTVEQKSKSTSHGPAKKKKRVYTEKELNIPTLNAIRPAGIQKPNGVKKGKTFVDDKESLMTILAMVQAEKEGNIESKMIRARQMEEIREARKAEADKREAGRKEKLVRTAHIPNTQTRNAHTITGGSQG